MAQKKAEEPSPASQTFRHMRRELKVTQDEMARILGVSAKAVQSYEQGWRQPPDAVLRLLNVVFIAHRAGAWKHTIRCWEIKRCPPRIRNQCRAYQTRQGHLCWLVRGTKCKSPGVKSCADGYDTCLKCKVRLRLLGRPSAWALPRES